MMSDDRRFRGGGLLLLALLAIPPRAEAQVDRAELRETLKAAWDSLQTLEFRAEEFVLGPDGQPDPALAFNRVDFKFAAGGRRAAILSAVDPSGAEKVVSNMRRDGRWQYQVRAFVDDPKVIDEITTTAETESHDDMPGATFARAQWFLCPFGKPLYAYLDDGATLESSRDASGHEVVTLAGKSQGRWSFRCELDPDHDWLARRGTINDVVTNEVERFAQDNGRWFPAEGTQRLKGQTIRFRISNLKINRPIPASAFARPRPQEGTLLVNRDTNVGRYEGGLEARQKLEEAHAPPPAPGASTAPPDMAAIDPPRTPWEIYLGVISALIFAVSLMLILGRRFKSAEAG